MSPDFELLSHTADIKIRAYGATKKALFCNALIGMFQAVGPRSPACAVENNRLVCTQLPKKHDVFVQSTDEQSLLVDFLSQALSLSDIYNEAYLAVDVQVLEDAYIQATVYGVAVTGFEVVEIKAVTYHDLIIAYKDGMWYAEIVFDI
jgi:SHS2 domain-containing protein